MLLLYSVAKILGICLWLRSPAKRMVGHLQGELQSNYRVGSVYVERDIPLGEK